MTAACGARRRFPADARLVAYEAAVLASAPAVLWRKFKKLRRDRAGHAHEADARRWTCRVRSGASDAPPPPRAAGPRLAFVGTGFGELRMIERLSAALARARPAVETTWCFQTREPAEAAARAHPEQPLAAMPFDFVVPVDNWLRNVSPDVVVFVEKFWYPVLARGAAGAGASVCVVNGRSWRRPARPGIRGAPDRALRRWIAGAFRVMCFQGEEHADAARPYVPAGVDVRVTGNLKYDLGTGAGGDADDGAARADPSREASLSAWLATRGDVPLLAAGSTREGDEAFVLRAFCAARREAPCALLLAPRQLSRVGEVVAAASAAGLRVSRRADLSRHHAHDPHDPHDSRAGRADAYVLDTMGELVSAYRHATAVFVGGTIAHLGHNVVEPLVAGVPVSFGPAPGHWRAEQRACEEAGVGFRVRTPDDLAAHWTALLRDPGPLREGVRTRAAALLSRQRGALSRTVDALVSVIDSAEGPRSR